MTVDWARLLLLPSLAAGILVLDKSLSESSDNLGFKCRAENTIGNTYRKVAGPEFGKKPLNFTSSNEKMIMPTFSDINEMQKTSGLTSMKIYKTNISED